MTTLSFNLTSSPGCAPLVCGQGDSVFVPLKTGSVAKSADGTGYLRAVITEVKELSLVAWLYTVEIEDSEISGSITADDPTGHLCCISCADKAILAKLALVEPDSSGRTSWQTFSLYQPGEGVLTAQIYLLRRHTGYRIHAAEIARHSGNGNISASLLRSGVNNLSFVNLGSLMTISNPSLTARQTLAPAIINPFEALAVQVFGAADIYSASSNGLELHLLTSEL